MHILLKTRYTNLILSPLQLALHLFQFLLTFIRVHFPTVPQHFQTEYREQCRARVVRINSGNNSSYPSEGCREYRHEDQCGYSAGEDYNPRMFHRHDSCYEERLIAQFRHYDDRERREKALPETALCRRTLKRGNDIFNSIVILHYWNLYRTSVRK